MNGNKGLKVQAAVSWNISGASHLRVFCKEQVLSITIFLSVVLCGISLCSSDFPGTITITWAGLKLVAILLP